MILWLRWRQKWTSRQGFHVRQVGRQAILRPAEFYFYSYQGWWKHGQRFRPSEG